MPNTGFGMEMRMNDYQNIFDDEALRQLFPATRTDRFFEALLGDSTEGAYDIALRYLQCRHDRLDFELHLMRRQGKCLACNLTYGLPQVFTRHPVIDINGLAKAIDTLLNGRMSVSGWELGRTKEVSNDLHVIPFTLSLNGD